MFQHATWQENKRAFTSEAESRRVWVLGALKVWHETFPSPCPSKLGSPSTYQTQTVAFSFSSLLHQSSFKPPAPLSPSLPPPHPIPPCFVPPDNCCAVSRGYGTGKTSSRAAADQGKRITKVCLCLGSVIIEFGMFAGVAASRVVVVVVF